MKITLRTLDSSNNVPALKESRNLELKTKFNTLTYLELDTNFINLVQYIKDIQSVISDLKALSSSTELSDLLGTIKDRVDLLEQNLTKIDLTKDLNKPVSTETAEKLNEKLNTADFLIKSINNVSLKGTGNIELKTINNNNIVGSGNIEIKPTKEQFIESIVTGVAGDVGYYGIFETSDTTNFNDIIQGSKLRTSTGSSMIGTWRQCGNLENNKALFLRIL